MAADVGGVYKKGFTFSEYVGSRINLLCDVTKSVGVARGSALDSPKHSSSLKGTELYRKTIG
jgi:hypothetical protein